MAPPPFLEAIGGKPTWVLSRSEWQTKHWRMPFTRYSPRLRRASVFSNFMSVRGRVFVACRMVVSAAGTWVDSGGLVLVHAHNAMPAVSNQRGVFMTVWVGLRLIQFKKSRVWNATRPKEYSG